MTPYQIANGGAAIPASEEFADHHERIRATVRRMDADEVDRQLPNLVDIVASESTDAPETMHFLIGVSFSTNDSLLDYRLDKFTETEESDRPGYETLKEAVSVDHAYLTFPYPPDPNFTAEALRGALLVEIEEQFSRRSQRRGTLTTFNGRTLSKLEQLWKKVSVF